MARFTEWFMPMSSRRSSTSGAVLAWAETARAGERSARATRRARMRRRAVMTCSREWKYGGRPSIASGAKALHMATERAWLLDGATPFPRMLSDAMPELQAPRRAERPLGRRAGEAGAHPAYTELGAQSERVGDPVAHAGGTREGRVAPRAAERARAAIDRVSGAEAEIWSNAPVGERKLRLDLRLRNEEGGRAAEPLLRSRDRETSFGEEVAVERQLGAPRDHRRGAGARQVELEGARVDRHGRTHGLERGGLSLCRQGKPGRQNSGERERRTQCGHRQSKYWLSLATRLARRIDRRFLPRCHAC